MEKVLVLMATYNGEKYIKEQIESILNQKGVEVHLLISDDSSTDNTINIVNEFTQENNISIIHGKFGSAQRNFYNLLENASGYDYYSLADQDDVWNEDKLYVAINRIKQEDETKPILYYGVSKEVNENLVVIPTKYKHHEISGFSSSLVAAGAQGCTMVFNNPLLMILKGKYSNTRMMHDSWICLTTFLIGGKVLFDPSKHMMYRIHGGNVFAKNRTKLIIKIFKKFFNLFSKKKDYLLSDVIKEWEKNFSEFLNEEVLSIFELIKNSKKLKNRFKIIFSRKFKSKYLYASLQFKVRTLRGKL